MTVELLLRREVHFTAIAFQHFASVLEDGVVVHPNLGRVVVDASVVGCDWNDP